MALFQQSVLTKYIKSVDEKLLENKWNEFTKIFHNAEKQTNIRNSKEEQYQEGFLRDLFVQIFGYTINPETNYNLLTEQKNVSNAKKADGAIVLPGRNGLQSVVAVIELKGTDTTDLSKIETQAFGYKNNQPECVYVITSNFEKLRFYIENSVDFIEFNLFNLTKEEFKILFVCLAFENIKANVPKHLKDESVSNENKITKQLYKDYSDFKRSLFNNLVEKNPEIDKLLLFKKTQKLLDRFLFIFFAEDRHLVPTNLIRRINLEWENLQKMRIPVSLYERYKMYFEDLNSGAKVTLPAFGKKTGDAITAEFEIFAYNGGLFAADELLDNVQIDDDILYKHTILLSDYDFESDVDVNILGHIFENSLNEIDEIKSEIEGKEVDKTKTKRKKDGVFYTPKYITKYIVDNTVGKLCEEKKAEFGIIDEEFAKGRKNRNKTTIEKLDKQLHTYRDWLLQITICDPACGSGAFLNQALEFLIQEHKYIDNLEAQLLGNAIGFPGAELHILENNIYGVDLNDESVEIAKLSLWLRTAQKGRKLNSLNNNIKCGNSLIDDPEIAGEKAFSWEKEFPEVFAPSSGSGGGFDVIIGNPPYVRMQNIDIKSRVYLSSLYSTAFQNYDLYVIFTEKTKALLNKFGIASFIMPKKFITSEYGEKIKSFIYENNLLERYIDFCDLQIFDDATTYTGIFFFSFQNKITFEYQKINYDINDLFDYQKITKIDYINLSKKNWVFLDVNSTNLFNKLQKNKRLKETEAILYVGLQTSADPVFILEIQGDELYSNFTKKSYNFKSYDIVKPLLKGAEIKRYSTPIPNFKIIFPYKSINENIELISKSEMENNYPEIWNYLNECKEKLESRENGKMKNDIWYGYVYLKNMTEFSKPKILTQVLCKNSSLALDSKGDYYFVGGGTAGGYGIRVSEELNKFQLLAILNSKLIYWYIKQFSSPFQGGFYVFNKSTLGEVPLPKNQLNFDKIVLYINEIGDKYNSFSIQFSTYFGTKYNLVKLSGKLEKWYELSFIDFIKELNKAIKGVKGTPLTKKDEFEWMDLFEENKKKALEIKAEIDKTDKEIDQMVYELYGLTEEEIKIVEGE